MIIRFIMRPKSKEFVDTSSFDLNRNYARLIKKNVSK